jgi:hypothetical protein
MIAGSIPAASAQPEERDVPEVDFGVEDKVLYEAVQPTGRGAETRPDPIRAEAVTTGAEVSKTNASAWHAAGFRGAVKVGIIDAFSATVWNAAQAAGEVPAPAGTFCRDGGAACDIWTVDPGALFGTAVAEIIHEMAPDASLYLARPITLGDYAALLDYFAAQGVQIIYNGLTVSYGSPGDGTGFEADLVDDAVSAGMMWVNWVGDLANGGYWRGTWVDASGDGYLDFAPGTNEMGFFCGPGYGLRWSDWTANPTDYHVYIYEDLDAVATRTVKASSTRAQVTGSAPWEDYNPSLSAAGCSGPADVDYLAIYLFDAGNGTAGDTLELGVAGGGEFWNNPYSASVPFADSANPGALAVGAIEPPLGTVAGPFSSHGPTNDGRFKPDLTAASGVSNFTFGAFFGTGAAAATTVGAAALVAGADTTATSAAGGHKALALTPVEISTYLTTQATVDRGIAGQDNVYGQGELILPAPPKPPTAVDDSYATPPDVTLTVAAAKGVLANDTHPDGDKLVVSKSDTTSAKGGTVAVKSDGSFTYTPASGFTGSDTFSYTASNGVMTDAATVTVLVGGVHTVGLVDPAQGKWYLYDEDGVQQSSFFFGNPGDFPIYGDWNRDGIETPGMYRQSDGFVYLRNSNTQGIGDIRFFFGNPGDVPLAGDFDGDGEDTVSIYRPSEQRFYIINELGANEGGLGAAEFSYVFGDPGDKPFVGDFNGNGEETVGLHRESTGLVYFRQTHTQGVADSQFIFGDPGDRLVAGDWNGNGVYSPALFRPSNTTMYFRYTNTQGNADAQWVGGQSPWLPISGDNGLG